MQLAVAETFADRVNLDPLAESETLESFRGFMSEIGVLDDSVAATMGLLAVRQFAAVSRDKNPTRQPVEQLEAVEVVLDEPLPQEVPDKRRKSENTRVQQLGDDLRKVRSEARTCLQPGYCVSSPGIKNAPVLHRPGACLRVPCIDYPRFRYVGDKTPLGSESHQICHLCAKAGAADRAEGGQVRLKPHLRRRKVECETKG